MKRYFSPAIWLPLALLLVADLGSRVLLQPACVQLSERDQTAYGYRPRWQARFDALSATCGVGLLSYDLKEDYTPAGRWVVAGLGLIGAALYLIAVRQLVGRFSGEAATQIAPTNVADPTQTPAPAATVGRWPPIGVILLAFAGGQVATIVVVWIAELVAGASTGFPDAAWRAISAFSSVGVARDVPAPRIAWVYALIAFIAAIGWPVWLLAWPRWRLRGARLRGLLLVLLSYGVFLAVGAGLIAALEMPRGKTGAASVDARLDAQSVGARYARSLVQVAAAAGAGLPTETIADRGVSDGTKVVLASVLLVGGIGVSLSGGVGWLLLLWALAAGCRCLKCENDEIAQRRVRAGVAVLAVMVGFTLVVAFGLLIIENRTASPYQTAPSFADALLEGASIACGGNLSTGVSATVTAATLSRGIRQNVDQYQYGMVWIVAAMFVGRVLPVIVAGWVTRKEAAIRNKGNCVRE